MTEFGNTSSQSSAETLRWLYDEADRAASGWDFSYLERRMSEAPLPWDYRTIIQVHLELAGSLLDMGTGGGEFLASLNAFPLVTMATESYPPNVILARERLSVSSIDVVQTDETGTLPFQSESFDLIINRHSPYQEADVYRVLNPGGIFVTQQVGSRNNAALNEALTPKGHVSQRWDLATAASRLRDSGLLVEKHIEAWPSTRFSDTGAVVWYLAKVPWQIPDFAVSRYEDRLLGLHRQIETEGSFDCLGHRFIAVARKPGENTRVSRD